MRVKQCARGAEAGLAQGAARNGDALGLQRGEEGCGRRGVLGLGGGGTDVVRGPEPVGAHPVALDVAADGGQPERLELRGDAVQAGAGAGEDAGVPGHVMLGHQVEVAG